MFGSIALILCKRRQQSDLVLQFRLFRVSGNTINPMVGVATAEDLEKRGHTAFVEEDFEEAVNLYTEALSLEPSNASLYITRAAASTKLENYTGM